MFGRKSALLIPVAVFLLVAFSACQPDTPHHPLTHETIQQSNTEFTSLNGIVFDETGRLPPAQNQFKSVDRVAVAVKQAAESAETPPLQIKSRTLALEYHGTFDDGQEFGMGLVFENETLRAEYYLFGEWLDMPLIGQRQNRNLTLTEYDTDGNELSRFVGEFPAIDPGGKYDSTHLNHEVIVGTWELLATGETREFYLHSTHSRSIYLDNTYLSVENDAVIEKRVQEFLAAVAQNNAEAAATHIHYPVHGYIDGNRVPIPDAAFFVANFEALFPNACQKTLATTVPHNMFTNWQGIMLGQGILWFNGEAQVIAINNGYCAGQ